MSSTTNPTLPRIISQEAFDLLVEENQSIFETSYEIAIQNTLQELKLQNVNTTQLITNVEGKLAWNTIRTMIKQIPNEIHQPHHLIILLQDLISACNVNEIATKHEISAIVETMITILTDIVNKNVKSDQDNNNDIHLYELALITIKTSYDIILTKQSKLTTTTDNDLPPPFTLPSTIPPLLPQPMMISHKMLKPWFLTVQSILKRDEYNKRLFRDSGIFHSLLCLGLDDNNNNDIDLVRVTCRTLRIYLGDDDFREDIHPKTFARARELGEDTNILALLTWHLNHNALADVELCIVCCDAYKTVLVNDLICNRAVFQHKALESSFTLLTQHQENIKPVIAILGLIRALARHDDGKRHVGLDETKRNMLLDIWRRHLFTSSAICASVASALGVILLRQPEISNEFAKNGVITLMIDSLKCHSESSEVHYAIFLAARNVVSHHTNSSLRKLFLEEGMGELTRQGIVKFPTQCEIVGKECLRDLGL
jgi:hypothetical protein